MESAGGFLIIGPWFCRGIGASIAECPSQHGCQEQKWSFAPMDSMWWRTSGSCTPTGGSQCKCDWKILNCQHCVLWWFILRMDVRGFATQYKHALSLPPILATSPHFPISVLLWAQITSVFVALVFVLALRLSCGVGTCTVFRFFVCKFQRQLAALRLTSCSMFEKPTLDPSRWTLLIWMDGLPCAFALNWADFNLHMCWPMKLQLM